MKTSIPDYKDLKEQIASGHLAFATLLSAYGSRGYKLITLDNQELAINQTYKQSNIISGNSSIELELPVNRFC